MKKRVFLLSLLFLLSACADVSSEESRDIAGDDQTEYRFHSSNEYDLEGDIYAKIEGEYRDFAAALPDRVPDGDAAVRLAERIEKKQQFCREQLGPYAAAAKKSRTEAEEFCANIGAELLDEIMLQEQNKAFIALIPALFDTEMRKAETVVIDLRTPEERAEIGFIAGTDKHLDYYADDFEDQVWTLDKNTPYLLYCAHGNRSRTVRNSMQALGFLEVYDLEGGTLRWMNDGYELTK